MTGPVSNERIAACYAEVRGALLAERNSEGCWTGELSASALSTATAVVALEMVRRGCGEHDRAGDTDTSTSELAIDFRQLIDGGLSWLAAHQNEDGGWGDTTKSISNISTTMLVHAAFCAAGCGDRSAGITAASESYIAETGGVQAVVDRYGKDKTFSIPILTHCALSGLVDWKQVQPLPFELACLPARFYKTVRLPVVSYALPALIAIGQVRYHKIKPWNPVARLLRRLSIPPSLRVLERIQPPNGGFLEATPLTSFVTMSLAGMGLSNHPVARRGIRFIADSVRDDGSWPIDTNLATWVTTLSVNALADDLPIEDRPPIRDWLLGQQYREVHPYTNADPGGWAWTDLPGGVPDADDTPGAILALLNLRCEEGGGVAGVDQREPPAFATSGGSAALRPQPPPSFETTSSVEEDSERERRQLADGVKWLLDVQNRNHGWPTFCRGWGALPFDRSAPDISAHVIRALLAWQNDESARNEYSAIKHRTQRAIETGFSYLAATQRADGSWLPLWFGNQFGRTDENPTYGTARVLAAFRDANRLDSQPAQRAVIWLRENQNRDGGWGGSKGIESSVEETSLAVEALLSAGVDDEATQRGLAWLVGRVEDGSYRETTPIGFYFAKLWYFEKMYPLSFMVSALRRAVHAFKGRVETVTSRQI